MEFNKAYNREDFLSFLKVHFLPEDFTQENTNVVLRTQTKYTKSAVKLGVCKSLDLVVYEIKNTSVNDARVGLSKEAFRMLADEWEGRALVMFVPVSSNANYRFSLITIDLSSADEGKIKREYSNPRRYSYYLGEGISYYTPNKYLNAGRVKDSKDLQDRFSVEILTKAFYNELSDWYAWAVKIIRFPNDISDNSDDDKLNNECAIRLITRLIFVWFLKQKRLVPDEFFDEDYIRENLIDGFNPHVQADLFGKSRESKYYKAILQNLFFAMLNSPITQEGKDTISERHFRKDRNDYDNNKLMRYEDKFKNPKLFIDIANRTVPFLNGGLFDCLDDKDNGMYIDGFSDRKVIQEHLIVPDYLFFGEEVGKDIDLSEFYGDNKKKKVSARGFIDILKRYNFTVEENTPFDQEVSLDPELLGKVFENLLASYNPETKTTARKKTGSFYTPREIVQFMVDESLIAHLKHTVDDELEEEYRKLMRYTDEQLILTDDQKKQIICSLYKCKIIDPACGSGAFPMGILQQMVHILSQVDPENKQWQELLVQNAIDETTDAYKNASSEERADIVADIERSFDDNFNRPDYARKLYLIENCIFGVDIQPIAVQISKLRFFISLVVDQKSNNIPADNFGIRPLPNLEAKFVAANTLIGFDKQDATLFDTDQIKEKESELKMAKHKIFSAKTSKTKRKYKECVKDLRVEISQMLKALGVVGNEEARKLAEWDMFDQNASSPFFTPEWMFGVSDGFDIVIGNPPYVQLQDNNGALAEQLKDCSYETFTRTGDLYCIFYERGFQLLNKKGHLCFITSNKWMRAGYGEITRSFFVNKTNPKLLIDFSGVKIFESATVDTNILLIAKEQNTGNTLCAVTKKEDKDRIKDLSVFVQQLGSKCKFSNSNSWVILSPIEQNIKRKIEAVGTPLKDWNINIYRGVLTGFNEAFIISGVKKNEILSNCQSQNERDKTEALIRPILRGRDIKRYGYDWADLWLIYIPWHFPLQFDKTIQGASEKAEKEFQKLYPTIYNHLLKYKPQLSDRNKAETGIRYEWYAMQRWGANYWEDFLKPKIVWKRVGSIIRFSYDENGLMALDSTCFATGEDVKYLACILNSNMGHYLLKDAPKTGTGDLLVSVQAVEPIKIPILNSEIKRELEVLFDKQLHSVSADVDKEINRRVYKLYDLSDVEIEFIENKII